MPRGGLGDLGDDILSAARYPHSPLTDPKEAFNNECRTTRRGDYTDDYDEPLV